MRRIYCTSKLIYFFVFFVIKQSHHTLKQRNNLGLSFIIAITMEQLGGPRCVRYSLSVVNLIGNPSDAFR